MELQFYINETESIKGLAEECVEQKSWLKVCPYSDLDADIWDELVADAPMATFLHTRRYLSYHIGRFHDVSLLIRDKNNKLLGLFPAAIDPDDSRRVVSHPGITYGGVLHTGSLWGEKILEVFQAICNYYAVGGFTHLRYKPVPNIYQQVPAADDSYALFRLNASRYRCDLACAIDLSNRLQPSQRRKRGLKKAQKNGVQVKEGLEFVDRFWGVLEENCVRKIGTLPVHSLDEIIYLHSLFPQNIEFVVGLYDWQVVAGVVLFSSHQVFRAQYIASSLLGNNVCALDLILEYCIEKAQARKARYFDFGTSNQNEGLYLKASLYQFKLEFGGGGVVQEFYEIPLKG